MLLECTSWVFFYSVVVMVYTALRFRSSAAALDAELTQSKLDTLRSQLRPHFLFNTLNAISVFVVEDADKAQQMLLRLSTLLRRSLDEEAHEVPLEQELAFVNDYLDIQRGRFGDQLIVELAFDPAVLTVRVPVFLLQPLLENAIEHGKFEDKCTTVVLGAGRRRDVAYHARGRRTRGQGRCTGCANALGTATPVRRLRHLYGPARHGGAWPWPRDDRVSLARASAIQPPLHSVVVMKALIVDDEPAARRGLRRRLGQAPRCGLRPGECGQSAHDAVEAIVERRPDVVLLDVQLGPGDRDSRSSRRSGSMPCPSSCSSRRTTGMR